MLDRVEESLFVIPVTPCKMTAQADAGSSISFTSNLRKTLAMTSQEDE